MNQKRSLLGLLLLCTSILHGMENNKHRKALTHPHKTFNCNQPFKGQNLKKLLSGLCCCCPRFSKKQPQIEDSVTIDTGQLWQLDLLPPAKLISQSTPMSSQDLKIWSIEENEQVGTIKTGYPITAGYGLSPDGTRAATSWTESLFHPDPSIVQIWDIETCKCTQKFEVSRPINGVNLIDDDNTLWYQSVEFSQGETKQTQRTYKYDLRENKIVKELFGFYLITQDGSMGARWEFKEEWKNPKTIITNLETDKTISEFPCSSSPRVTTFSSDKKSIAYNDFIVNSNIVSIFEVETGQKISAIKAGDTSIMSAFFNPDNSNELITSTYTYGNASNNINLWNIKESKLIYEKKFDKPFSSLDFNGKQFAVNVGEQTVVFPYPKKSKEEIDS